MQKKIMKDMVIVVVRIPSILRRKLKIAAAFENCSMNDKAKSYIESGILKDDKVLNSREYNEKVT